MLQTKNGFVQIVPAQSDSNVTYVVIVFSAHRNDPLTPQAVAYIHNIVYPGSRPEMLPPSASLSRSLPTHSTRAQVIGSKDQWRTLYFVLFVLFVL